ELAESCNDFVWDSGVAIDGGGIKPGVNKLAHSSGAAGHLVSFRWIDFRVGKEQGSLGMPKEQRLGKSQFLGAGEHQFLGLLSLLSDLFRCQRRELLLQSASATFALRMV